MRAFVCVCVRDCTHMCEEGRVLSQEREIDTQKGGIDAAINLLSVGL